MSGWISLDRAITKHWLWQNEKFTKGQAWVDLLLWAAHTPNKVLMKGTLIPVARGEQIRSQVTLAKAWGWDRKTVSRFLKLLEKDDMIVTRVDHLTSYISICNYDAFQDNKKDSPHLKGQLKGQQATSREDTINKGNKDNKDNKDISRINYECVTEVYNRCLTNGSNLSKMTDTRKKLVKKFFDEFGFTIEKFENYLSYINENENCQWMFERRPMNDGTGRSWGKQKFEYFISEKCYLNIKENIDE